MKTLLHYLSKTKLAVMFCLILTQQGLTAFGTYALAKAGLSFDHRSLFIFWILMSLGMYLLTPVFGVFIRRLETQLSFDSYRVFLQESLFSKAGRSSVWQNKKEKDRFLTSIGSDAHDYLGLMLFLMMDIFSFSLSKNNK